MPPRRQSQPPPPEIKHFTPDEIERGIRKLGRCIEKVKTLSDHRTGAFGRSYGVLIKGGKLDRFLGRAVFVADKNNKLVHVEYVPEVGQEPNYDAALAAARKAAGA